MPVYNSLIRDAVFVIQDLSAELHEIIWTRGLMETNFENLRECLDDASVLIAINLHCIYQSDLSLRTFTERFKNGGEFLKVSDIGVLNKQMDKYTVTSRSARPSI
jgi:hypothetical protein